MIDLSDVHNKYRNSIFITYLKKQTPEYHRFLIILHPIMQYVFDELLFEYKILDSVIRNFIIDDFKKIFTNLIGKLCLLEMSFLKKQNKLQGKTSRDRFDNFIEILSDISNIKAIYKKYPVLKERMEIFCFNYLNSKQKLLKRYYKDSNSIVSVFFSKYKQVKPKIISITMIGDLHCQAQAVSLIKLKFNNNKIKSIIYKPRNIKLMESYAGFANFFKEISNSELYLGGYLDKGEYGWIEYIEYKACKQDLDVQDYYYNLGVLSAVIYILGGRDFHAENIIVSGNHPFLIDLECLYSPTLGQEKFDTISDTLILPSMHTEEQWINKNYDYSAYGHNYDLHSLFKHITWFEVGLDTMYIEKNHIIKSSCNNIPTLQFKKVDPLKYRKFFIKGFKYSYKIIMCNKEKLRFNYFTEEMLRLSKVRLLVNATAFYTKFIEESMHPSLLHDKGKTAAYFSSIRTEFVDIKENEANDMFCFDIPYFSCDVNNNQIFNASDNLLSTRLLKTGLFNLLERLDKLSDSDYRKHEEYIFKLLYEGKE